MIAAEQYEKGVNTQRRDRARCVGWTVRNAAWPEDRI